MSRHRFGGRPIAPSGTVRRGRVVDAASTDPAVIGTRRLADAIAAEPRVDATVLQTVGGKSYDGFVLAIVRP